MKEQILAVKKQSIQMWSILIGLACVTFVSGFAVSWALKKSQCLDDQLSLAAHCQYIDSILHDIRISSSTLQLGTETLHGSPELEEDSLRVLDYMDTAVQVLKTTTENLAHFNTIMSGKPLVAKVVPVDLVGFVRDLRTTFHAHPINSQVPIKFVVDGIRHRVCMTDPRFLKHIATNLLHNAKEHTVTGSVSFRLRIVDAVMRLEVLDTGSGVRASVRPQLFKYPIRNGGTVGMSLYSCRAMTTAMAGAVGYEALRKGSRFWVSVPYFPDQTSPGHEPFVLQTTAAVLSRPVDDAPPPSGHLKILITEDDCTNRDLMAMTLTSIDPGICIKEASQGQEAVDACSGASPPFDLVFMDLVMPVKDGYQAAQEILARRPDTRIVAVTGSEVQAVEPRCREIGFAMIITKPLTRKTLQRAISSFQ